MSDLVREVGADEFDEVVLQAGVPVIVDFWAPWCGPCRMVAPQIEALAEKTGDSALFVKVNIDEARELAMKYGVMSIPTIAKFERGSLTKSVVGARSASDMAKEFGI